MQQARLFLAGGTSTDSIEIKWGHKEALMMCREVGLYFRAIGTFQTGGQQDQICAKRMSFWQD